MKDSLNRFKDWLVLYLAYVNVVVMIATLIATLNPNYVLNRLSTAGSLVGAIILLPLLVIFVSRLEGSFAKWLRIFLFYAFRAEAFAGVGLLLLSVFTVLFLFNFVRGVFQGEQIFLNVLGLNAIFIFFLALVITGKFAVNHPAALLIRKSGRSEVYLYQNGVLRHIPDPPTLYLLGYSFRDVVDIGHTEFRAYKVKPDLPSVTTAPLVHLQGKPDEVWMVFNDSRKRVPDAITLHYLLQNRSDNQAIQAVTEETLQKWDESAPLSSVIRGL